MSVVSIEQIEPCTECKCTPNELPMIQTNGVFKGSLKNASFDFMCRLLHANANTRQQNLPKERSNDEPPAQVGMMFLVVRDDDAKGESRYRKLFGKSQRDGTLLGIKRTYCKSKPESGQKLRRERFCFAEAHLPGIALIHITEDTDRRLQKRKCKCHKKYKITNSKKNTGKKRPANAADEGSPKELRIDPPPIPEGNIVADNPSSTPTLCDPSADAVFLLHSETTTETGATQLDPSDKDNMGSDSISYEGSSNLTDQSAQDTETKPSSEEVNEIVEEWLQYILQNQDGGGSDSATRL